MHKEKQAQRSTNKLLMYSNFKYLFFIWFLVILIQSCGNGDETVDSNTLVVSTIEAKETPEYTISQKYVGEVESARKSKIGFEIGGMLKDIPADEGDIVKKGDILAELDTQRLVARLAELRASRDQEQANLELAQITRQRTKEALDLDAVSFQDYDEADKNYKARKASLEQAKSAVNTLEVDIDKSKLKAPFNAIVSKRYLDEGEVIQAGEQVLEIVESTTPEIRAGLPSSMVQGINVGDMIVVSVNGKQFNTIVKSILPLKSQDTRTIDVILSIEDDTEYLRDGDLANLTIDKSIQQQGFWLPMSSLTESSRGLWSCYVAIALDDSEDIGEATHKVERRELELLHQESDRVFVQGIIDDGDLVVSEGVQRLVPDLHVKINNATNLSGGTE